MDARGAAVGPHNGELLDQFAALLFGHNLVPTTVNEAVVLCIDSKRERGLRHSYILALSSALRIFGATFGDRHLHTIRPGEIEAWVSNAKWKSETRRGYLQSVRTLFSMGIRRGWCYHNAAMKVDAPIADDQPPGILSVDETRRLMIGAATHDRSLVPFLAVQLFGGLRVIEARRMTWCGVNCRFLNVSAEQSKTRARRLVPLSPQLKTWLDIGGDLPPPSWRKRLERIRTRAEIPWPRNCLRHSFVSYALPLHGAAKVAQWAGHSESVLFNHYRALVTEDDARAYFQILPP